MPESKDSVLCEQWTLLHPRMYFNFTETSLLLLLTSLIEVHCDFSDTLQVNARITSWNRPCLLNVLNYMLWSVTFMIGMVAISCSEAEILDSGCRAPWKKVHRIWNTQEHGLFGLLQNTGEIQKYFIWIICAGSLYFEHVVTLIKLSKFLLLFLGNSTCCSAYWMTYNLNSAV
jgi:hypothetical protein